MNERDKLIEELMSKFYFPHSGSSPMDIADYILDRESKQAKELDREKLFGLLTTWGVENTKTKDQRAFRNHLASEICDRFGAAKVPSEDDIYQAIVSSGQCKNDYDETMIIAKSVRALLDKG